SMFTNLIESSVEIYASQSEYPEDWDLDGLENFCTNLMKTERGFIRSKDLQSLTKESLIEDIINKGKELYKLKEEEIGEENFREIERVILLKVVDSKWMDHIDAMDQLRQGIGLRAYGQEDPVRAYQIEGYDMFEEMNQSIWEETVGVLFHVEEPEKVERERVAKPITPNKKGKTQQTVVKKKKIGRNDPCPCGSGKKYKKCCGAN